MTSDQNMKDYLHRKLVPPGFRPLTDDEIERALDLMDEGPLDVETVLRILAKSRGEISLSYKTDDSDPKLMEECDESNELLALHRSEGDVESEEVRDKLEKYRQQAEEDEEPNNAVGDDDA